MNGFHCAVDVEVTSEMTEAAIALLDGAAFVGLTEEWNDSICLFHAMYGGELNPHSFSNVRSTNDFAFAKKEQEATGEAYRPTPTHVDPGDDPHDWAFYLAAKALYRKRQRQYGLPVYEGRG